MALGRSCPLRGEGSVTLELEVMSPQEGATQAEHSDKLQPANSQRFVPWGLLLFPEDLPSLGESHLSCLNPVFTSHFHPQGPEGIFPNLHDPELKGQ